MSILQISPDFLCAGGFPLRTAQPQPRSQLWWSGLSNRFKAAAAAAAAASKRCTCLATGDLVALG